MDSTSHPFNIPSGSTGGVGGITGRDSPVHQESLASYSTKARNEVMTSETTTSASVAPNQTTTPQSETAKKVNFSVLKGHLTKAFAQVKDIKFRNAKTGVENKVKATKSQLGSLGERGILALNKATGKVFEKIRDKLSSKTDESTKTIGKSVVNLAAKTDKSIDSNDIKLQKQIQKTILVAAKRLKPNEGLEVSSDKLKNHVFVVLKDSGGKIEVFMKNVKLGSGAFGDAYRVTSSATNESEAIKYGKVDKEDAEITAKAKEDLLNEHANLEVLNEDSPKEGIQARVKISTITHTEGTAQTVSKGKLYSNGDFQKQVFLARSAYLLEIRIGDLASKSEAELRAGITKQTDRLTAQLETLSKEYKALEAQQTESPNPQLQVSLSEKKNEIRKSVMELTDNIKLAADELIGKEKGLEFGNKGYDIYLNIISNKPFNIKESVDSVFTGMMLELAQKCQKQDTVSTPQRMSFASNIVVGLKHMHGKGIIHGDLKPKNFFWNEQGAVIADFGGAQRKGIDYETVPTTTKGYAAGSYLDAMEFYRSSDKEGAFKAGQALDQREIGVSLYEMITGGSVPEEKGNIDKFYGRQIYDQMQSELTITFKEAGLAENDAARAAFLIARMSQPIKFENNKFPVGVPIPPLTDNELTELASLLKRVS